MRTPDELLRAVYDMGSPNRLYKANERIVQAYVLLKYNQEQMVEYLHTSGYHPEAEFVKTWTSEEWAQLTKGIEG